MKAIVLEIKNGEAAVLREDGIVVTTRQKCRVGDTIEVDDRVKIGGVKRFNRIARLSDEHGVRIVLGMSGDRDALPEFITKYAI